jgi:hypothetical protein
MEPLIGTSASISSIPPPIHLHRHKQHPSPCACSHFQSAPPSSFHSTQTRTLLSMHSLPTFGELKIGSPFPFSARATFCSRRRSSILRPSEVTLWGKKDWVSCVSTRKCQYYTRIPVESCREYFPINSVYDSLEPIHWHVYHIIKNTVASLLQS